MKSRSSNKAFVILGVVLVLGVGAVVYKNAPTPEHVAEPAGPTSYAELSVMPTSGLTNVDIALMNLLCAEGLPGAEGLDVKQSLAILDQWAEEVRQAEAKYLPTFRRDPARYDNSLAKFKAVNMVLTLKEDLGCGYNLELVTSGRMADIGSTTFFRDSSDIFLHGFTQRRKGSCASLPVLAVALGRRCGYPLYLVSCKGHLFFRWDDGTERFNVEAAIEGADSKPDSYYRQWPYPFDGNELESEKYLKSLSPAEELGVFASLRAACLEENGSLNGAAEAYRLALNSFPDSKYLRAYLSDVKGED
jgi:hypothetical protein